MLTATASRAAGPRCRPCPRRSTSTRPRRTRRKEVLTRFDRRVSQSRWQAPAGLDAQLEGNVRRWLADPRKGAQIDRAARALTVSPIFDWFAEDFSDGVVAFVAAHLPPEEAIWIRSHARALRVRYLDYDWSLNDASRRAAP